MKSEFSSEAFKNSQFRVVMVHIPPAGVEYWDPGAWHNKNESLWFPLGLKPSEIMPLLTGASVDLVLSGHSHLMQRGLYKETSTHVVIAGGGTPSLENINDKVQDTGEHLISVQNPSA